ncbi:MAG: HAD family hydrolase [Alphaproteobacteria bacterium]|nr:HAD family hydrolase [Alphaproteobacteria bacterium]
MIKAILFDINGTLSEIWTSEVDDNLYRTVSNFLDFQGVKIDPLKLKQEYFAINEHQRLNDEDHAEFDAVALFKEIIEKYQTPFTKTLSAEKLKQLPVITAELYRGASRFSLKLYDGVQETLDKLRKKYKLACVSDAQSAWALPELNSVGLLDYFSPIIVSGDYGYRKPDKRLFEKALKALGVKPSEAIFVGNDLLRDVHGANEAGIISVFFKSNQGDHEYKATPKYTMTDFKELLKIVAKIEKKEKAA